jgi:hypothetical protein
MLTLTPLQGTQILNYNTELQQDTKTAMIVRDSYEGKCCLHTRNTFGNCTSEQLTGKTHKLG